jgi:hypothetical protein
MFSLITLPGNFTSDVASSTNDTISSFSGFIVLILGVLLAGVVLEMIITAIRHK